MRAIVNFSLKYCVLQQEDALYLFSINNQTAKQHQTFTASTVSILFSEKASSQT